MSQWLSGEFTVGNKAVSSPGNPQPPTPKAASVPQRGFRAAREWLLFQTELLFMLLIFLHSQTSVLSLAGAFITRIEKAFVAEQCSTAADLSHSCQPQNDAELG